MTQPEPIRDMKPFEDFSQAVQNMRDANHRVILYSDDIHRELKEQWVEQNIPNLVDELRWCSTDDLVNPDNSNRIIVTTQFYPPRWRKTKGVMYFFGFADTSYGFGISMWHFWRPTIISWANFKP